ncbi:kinase-like protein [Macrolepiota fuliginosa MF-IS2]|uniref:Kinase-like protein n=1 Tax=Macrolepiota fuliginosa MF-IS2 TaxID=1400762 RepID=A0A9P5XH48_9AGAR|nr:kinase-like protein [Macrolepiota fuliginosa MF-IS2]
MAYAQTSKVPIRGGRDPSNRLALAGIDKPLEDMVVRATPNHSYEGIISSATRRGSSPGIILKDVRNISGLWSPSGTSLMHSVYIALPNITHISIPPARGTENGETFGNTLNSHYLPVNKKRLGIIGNVYGYGGGSASGSSHTLGKPRSKMEENLEPLSVTSGPNQPLPTFICDLARTTWSRVAFSSAFSGAEAQLIANYLSMGSLCVQQLLHQANLGPRDGIHILDLLCRLVKSTKVYPQCYVLKGVKIEKDPFQGGGFADVYRGAYKGQTICVKVFRIFQKGDRTRILRNCVKEMLMWARLAHDNILPFYGIFCLDEVAQRLCLVSPWMKNGNLGEYLENNPNAPRMFLIQDVIDGLSYLHEMSIAHGDLKMQNVLISDYERALLTDFGLSIVVMTTSTGASSTAATGRTTAFTAPELIDDIEGEPLPTKGSDVWSFGCLCLEVFTGNRPYYRCKREVQIMRAIHRGEKPSQPRGGDDVCKALQGWLRDMVISCWETDPQKRPTFMDMLDILTVNMDQSDERPKASLRDSMGKSSFREDMRAQSGMEVDHVRVERLARCGISENLRVRTNKQAQILWRPLVDYLGKRTPTSVLLPSLRTSEGNEIASLLMFHALQKDLLASFLFKLLTSHDHWTSVSDTF